MPGARKYKHPGRISIWTIQKLPPGKHLLPTCLWHYKTALSRFIGDQYEVMIVLILEEFSGIIE